MSGSTYGTIFRITTWGESHGAGVGVVVDGCPSGLSLTEADIQVFLDRRKPGTSRYSTPRKEGDQVEILSGVFEGKTTGTPISLLVRNTSQRSADYSEIASYYRPGHADMTYDMKYGFRDYRGGGRSSGRETIGRVAAGCRSSGRETIGRVAAGAIAVKILNSLGIQLFTYTRSIGPVKIHPERFQIEETSLNPLCMPDAAAAQEASEYLDGLMKEGDSAGGVIECIIRGMKPGVGDPAFEKLNANLGKAILSIGAVKGFEIGDGFAVARARGSQNNDPYAYTSDGTLEKLANHSGGILGGISDGSDIIFRAAIKPTPSISMEQDTVNKSGENIRVRIKGRHDPIIVPRAVVVVEAMAAITLLDMLFASIPSRMDNLIRFFNK